MTSNNWARDPRMDNSNCLEHVFLKNRSNCTYTWKRNEYKSKSMTELIVQEERYRKLMKGKRVDEKF